MSVLEIYVGLPGSGKTTHAKDTTSRWPRGTVARVSRDDIRRNLFCTHFIPDEQDFEDTVTAVQHASITALLRCGVVVLCDDTNLYPGHVETLIAVAKSAGAGWAVRDFTAVPLETCIARDATRPPNLQVGEKRIREMSHRFDTLHRDELSRLIETG